MQVRRKRRPAIDGSEATAVGARRSLWDRHFWAFACGIVLISVFTHAFDYSLVPLSCKGVFITRPYCGLHSDAIACTARAARSHAKYGLSYTNGYRTLALGDPPGAQPQRDIGQLPAETWITALGMKLFGAHDWSLPLLDAILPIPTLALAMLLLRKLYGSGCALLSGLLLALLPLSGYFGFQPLVMLLVLWALRRCLLLTGKFGDESGGRLRHAVELAVAQFLLIQLKRGGRVLRLGHRSALPGGRSGPASDSMGCPGLPGSLGGREHRHQPARDGGGLSPQRPGASRDPRTDPLGSRSHGRPASQNREGQRGAQGLRVGHLRIVVAMGDGRGEEGLICLECLAEQGPPADR